MKLRKGELLRGDVFFAGLKVQLLLLKQEAAAGTSNRLRWTQVWWAKRVVKIGRSEEGE
ncbi:MAG TPA: hypothetical protein VMI32_10300 [Candidatus Solibacter sp.]|nr:hypothetical protein [Candidatus Solibacter sp.]